jgi:Relaxase/Mobilisation nuclease domain/RepB DNA-primase from phage plasmid
LHNRAAMIGKPIKGTSFRGLLDYLAGRDGAALIGGNMEGRNPRELAREFAFSRALRPRLGKAACHIPLRLPYDERLSVAQWQRIGERIMAGMGFEDCSYAMYLHPQDPQGEHPHIVASRVTHLGDCVDDSFDMERLMRIERRIEKDYGLREVPYRKTAARRPRRGEYQFRERTGQASERERLQEVVGAAARPGLAVDEFVAALERKGVELRPAITSTGRVNGMRYRRGEHTFSGSSLGADFTWPGLLGRRGLVFEAARDLPALVGAGRRFDAGALGAVIAGASAEGPAAMRVAAGAAGGGAADRGPPAGGGSRSGGDVSPPEADVSPQRMLASLPAPLDDFSLASEIPEGAMATDRTQQTDRIDAGEAGGTGTPDAAGRIAEGAPIAGGGGIDGGMGGGAGDDGQAAGSSPRGGGRGGRPDTADQVARQLAALGSPRYDVLILEVATGEHLHHRTGLTAPGVAAAIPWLKHLNAHGCEILVRPSAPAGLSHFEGVHLGALREASAAGFQPVAVLRAPDGGREVWMRGGADLPPGVQELVDRELTRRLRPGRAAQTPGYGHLAGFTSPFAQRAGGLERPPFLTLEEDGGRVYGGFRALAAEARARAAAEVLEQRAEREIAGLGRQAAAVGEGAMADVAAAGVAAPREGSERGGSEREESIREGSAGAGGAQEGSAREGAAREGSARAEGEIGGLGAQAAASVAPGAVDGTPPRATAGPTFAAAASSPGWSCVPASGAAGAGCTLAIGGLGGGGSAAATFAVRADSPLPTGVQQIGNVACVAATGLAPACGQAITPPQVTTPAIGAEARDAGISQRTLKRAKRKEGVRTTRRGFGAGSTWLWSLPEAGAEAEQMDGDGVRGVEGGLGGEGVHTEGWPPSGIAGMGGTDGGLDADGAGLGAGSEGDGARGPAGRAGGLRYLGDADPEHAGPSGSERNDGPRTRKKDLLL